jgi:hypothetical protein
MNLYPGTRRVEDVSVNWHVGLPPPFCSRPFMRLDVQEQHINIAILFPLHITQFDIVASGLATKWRYYIPPRHTGNNRHYLQLPHKPAYWMKKLNWYPGTRIVEEVLGAFYCSRLALLTSVAILFPPPSCDWTPSTGLYISPSCFRSPITRFDVVGSVLATKWRHFKNREGN